MSDYSGYIKKLLDDLPEQYKGRQNLEALISVIGRQMDDIASFYRDILEKRTINSASGTNLDMVGDILVLTRIDAMYAMNKTRTLTDDEYRRMLIYKTSTNFGDATYSSIMNCIRIVKDDLLGFRIVEEPEKPATIILETKEKPSRDGVVDMLNTPIPRAGGVGLIVRANDGGDPWCNVTIATYTIASISGDSGDDNIADYTWYADNDGTAFCDQDYNILIV